MTMTVTEALGWATTATETRMKQWRDAASGHADDSELWDADTDERNNMADKYQEALDTLNTFGVVGMTVDDKGSIRIVNVHTGQLP